MTDRLAADVITRTELGFCGELLLTGCTQFSNFNPERLRQIFVF